MANIPGDLKYSKTHEWLRNEGDNIYTLGISDFAQSRLGDIVFVELPENNSNLNAGDDIIVIESVKTAADVYAPVSGEVIETNASLEDNPALINSDPYKEGWLLKIRIQDNDQLNQLMDAEAYANSIDED